MNSVYIAMELLAALTILILIYANIYEVKHHTKKRDLFTKLLIVNEMVVLADAISWMRLGWNKRPMLLSALILITYILPTVLHIIFSLYLYEHISLNKNVNKKPFNFMVYYSIVNVFLTLAFFISGKLWKKWSGSSGRLRGIFSKDKY